MNTSTAKINITCKASHALLLVFSSAYILALLSIWLIAIPAWIKLISSLIAIYFGTITIKQYALLKADNSVIRIISSGDNKCKVEFQDGSTAQANIISISSLFDCFVVLVIKNKSNKITLVIAKDSISQEQFYMLRLYLRSLNK
ncbi:MAG: protein YgfX [Gammaproteobacteria bacterium]